MRQVLSIDPGTSGCGWAIWDITRRKNWELLRYGVFVPVKLRGNDTNDLQRWQYEAEQVSETVAGIGKYCESMYVEYPSVFGGGVAAQSGAIVKLATLVGMIMGGFQGESILVPVVNWKGQLPKEIVAKRVKKILPNCKAESHAIDAIGIGLYLQGRF